MDNTQNIDTSSPEFQNALNLIRHTHQSLFLTGKAGTGKSTFLRYVCQNTRKKHVILAPTGIAAINAGGQTLHSFFKLPFHPLVPDDPRFQGRRIKDFLRYNKEHIKLLRELELIVIDEISMVRADIIDFVDRVLRIYTGRMREPFGGKQMLFIGDVFQLEPVVKSDERDILQRFYPNPYFFTARVFQEMELVSIELTKVFRQKDAAFIRALDHIREGNISPLELEMLNLRVSTHEEGEDQPKQDDIVGHMNIVLATRRDNVDYINQTHLDALSGSPTIFTGETKGEFPESSLPTLMKLEIKPGAQIIFIKNDPDKNWVNGTLGIITSIDEKNRELLILTEDEREVTVSPAIWENVRYTYNEQEKKIEEQLLGTFTQFPIKLAWAITIHKSQGLTFERATIDFGGGTFAGGQAYVALSRCRSMQGMTLAQPLSQADIFVKPEIKQFAQRFNDSQAMSRALQTARADIEYEAASQAFDRGDMKEALDHFFIAIHARYDIEKPLPRRFIQRKLSTIGQLRSENEALKQKMQADQDQFVRQLEEQRERLRQFAKEYVEMGNQCITEAHSVKAALANYDKAIKLDPTLTEAWVRKGVTLLDDKQWQEAFAALNEAVRLSPNMFKTRLNRGRAFMEMGRLEEAINDLDKASSLNKKNARAHELLGDCFSRLGDEEKADIHWLMAEELRKKNK